MDKGFYHPELGYWQAVGGGSMIEDYPSGTFQVPLRPSADYDWQNDMWVYISPPEPTQEELRAAMPAKTLREFRDFLADMGIFSQMVTAKIEEIPFEVERQKAINAWEVSTYINRTDPYVDMIGAMFDKTPQEIDKAWVI